MIKKMIWLGFVSVFAWTNAQAQFPQIPPTNQAQFAPLVELPTPNVYRSASGTPGSQYWQQEVDYKIDVSLNGDNHTLTGSQVIQYTNNSPDNLNFLWLTLEQNKFKPDSRGSIANDSDGRWRGAFENGGFKLSSAKIKADGKVYEAAYKIIDTQMRIDLEKALLSEGHALEIHLEWSFEIPEFGADRHGRQLFKHGWVYELAQWYPRMYTYDDVNGWNVLPYLGQGEFYLEYGDFDINITAPREMIVVATGTLLNPETVYTEEQIERWEKSKISEKTVMIRSKKEVDNKKSRPSGKGPLTWRFSAENVRDFAWAASSAFIVDAASWNGIQMISAYPEEGIGKGDAKSDTAGWEHSTEYVLHTIRHYSRQWFQYPYPVAINVGGIVGGMEYPMIVFCSINSRGPSLFGVTDHEFGHEWFPMIVGSDERRYAWMDEGFNTFINFYSEKAYYEGADMKLDYKRPASILPRFGQSPFGDQAIHTYPDNIRRNALGFLAYFKPGYGLVLLREHILGPERFDEAFQTYINNWKYKHPQPADFFRTIENVSGEDLDWFWRGWFQSTGLVDQSVTDVKVIENDNGDKRTVIVLETQGDLVMPVLLSYTTDAGEKQITLPVEIWKTTTQYGYVLEGEVNITSVSIDKDGWIPDENRENNTWRPAEEAPTEE